MGNGMNKVLPGLFVGNFRDAKDQVQLNNNNITHILSIHDNAKPILPDKKYLCISVSDTPDQDLTRYFRECNKFIHECRIKGGAVLVHCLAGVSRSVTVTTAYLMTISDLVWEDALNTVKVSRTVASPNYGFQKQLAEFGNKNIRDERKWLKSEYGNPSEDDLIYIKTLQEQAQKEEQNSAVVHPDPRSMLRPTGSSTTGVVNREEPVLPMNSSGSRNGAVFDG